METKKQQPHHEVVISFGGGIIKAAIWRHEDTKGQPRYSVSFNRGYKDSSSGKWVYTEFFNKDELLAIGRVAEIAYGHIHTNTWKNDADTER